MQGYMAAWLEFAQEQWVNGKDHTAIGHLINIVEELARTPTTATPSADTPAPECAHEWINPTQEQWQLMYRTPIGVTAQFATRCKHCDVTMRFDAAPVSDART